MVEYLKVSNCKMLMIDYKRELTIHMFPTSDDNSDIDKKEAVSEDKVHSDNETITEPEICHKENKGKYSNRIHK